MNDFTIKKIHFYLYLYQIEKSILSEYKYIILKMLYGNFKIINICNNNELFIENKKIKKNIFFQQIFNEKKLYYNFDMNVTPIELYYIKNIIYSNIDNNSIFLNDIENFTLIKLNNFEKILNKLNLVNNSKYRLIKTYLDYINTTYDIDYDFNNEKIKYLLCDIID